MDGGTIRKTDLDPLCRPRGHSREPRHWKAGSWYVSSAVCEVCVIVQQHKSVNIWQDKRHAAMEGFVLKCREVVLLRTQTELCIKGFFWWHRRVSAASVTRNSLAVRYNGTKAEGSVFSLTLSSLMMNTWGFAEVDRSYLVLAVDTECYWAETAQSRRRYFNCPVFHNTQHTLCVYIIINQSWLINQLLHLYCVYYYPDIRWI